MARAMTTGGWQDGLLFWGPVAIGIAMLAGVAAWPGWRRLARREGRPKDRLHAGLLAGAVALLIGVAALVAWRL